MGFARALALGLVLTGCSGEVAGPAADPGTPLGPDGNPIEPSAGASSSGGSGGGSAGGGGGKASGGSAGSANPAGGSAGTSSVDPDPPVAPTSFTCNPAVVPASAPLRRLTRVQFENTLSDLLTFALGDRNEALGVRSALAAEIAALPSDERPRIEQDLRGTYRRLDQGVAQGHVDAWYALAAKAGAELTNAERIETAVGACATDGSNVSDCLDAFLNRFGARVLRRPLSGEDLEFYRGFYGDTASFAAEGYADVIAGLLSAPDFLYLVESGDAAVSGQTDAYELLPFEIASRLSYHFWNTLPDDELWDRASNGALLDDAEYERQVDRLFADDRSKLAARDFYREWLKLEDLAPLDEANGVPVYDAFTGDDRPTSMLNGNMLNEVLDLLDFMSWDEPAGIDQLLTTQLIFPKTDDLARLYGVEIASEPVAAPNDERPGLLTRAAFLATGSERTRPIMKGVFIRENVLCDHISAPPANAQANLPDLPPDLTTREMVEEITRPSTCAGCHVAQINYLGFPTEAYDALGRFRSVERIFDEDGELIAEKPIDTTGTPQITEEDFSEVTNAAELMQLVVASGKPAACLARHYFRYSFGRWENVAADGCALEQLRTALVDSSSLATLLREVALTPEFRRRTILP
jgi:hypothetical protein